NMKDLVHVAIGGGGGVLRRASVLTRAQIGRVPIPPMMLGVRLLVLAMVLLGVVEEVGKGGNIPAISSFPLAARQPLPDLLELPAIPIRILKRDKREIRAALRFAPRDARIFLGIVERAAGIVEDLADVHATSLQVVAGGGDILHGEDQLRRPRSPRHNSLAED